MDEHSSCEEEQPPQDAQPIRGDGVSSYEMPTPTQFYAREPAELFQPEIVEVNLGDDGRFLALQNARTAKETSEVMEMISSLIIESLIGCSNLFETRFGASFMDTFRESVLRLSVDELAFIDDWNKSCIDMDSYFTTLGQVDLPIVVQPALTTYDFLHGNVGRESGVVYLNEQFMNLTGWTMEELNRRGMNGISLCHPSSLLFVIRETFLTIVRGFEDFKRSWKEPLVMEIPDYNVLCVDGSYRLVKMIVHILLAPSFVPVYFVIYNVPHHP